MSIMTRSFRVIMGFVFLLKVVGSVGCFYGHAATGPSRLSLAKMGVTPPSLMIARKVARTAYLVLDPAKVPPEMTILVGGQDRGGRLTDTRVFIERDLKHVFANYFQDVQIVSPGVSLGPNPYVVIDVKLDRIEVVQTSRWTNGAVAYQAGAAVLTWGLGLRAPESGEYLYSFAGESAGVPGEDPVFVFRSMFEAAITDMLKGYTDKKVHQALLGLSREAPLPQTPTTGI